MGERKEKLEDQDGGGTKFMCGLQKVRICVTNEKFVWRREEIY